MDNKPLQYKNCAITQEVKAIIQLNLVSYYNMRNIFLEKSYTKCGEENNSRLFSEKSKLSISPD